MSEFTFADGHRWPWLLLLPVFTALVFAVLSRSRRAASLYGAQSVDRCPAPLWRSVRLSLIALLGFICWLDPRYGEEIVPVERRGLDVIFALDTSRSMLAADMEPSRLARAKQDIASVLVELQHGDRAALVVFAGEARSWIPLTHDLDSFAQLLTEVDTNVVYKAGTDLAAALRKCKDLALPDAAATTAVVLLTDGEDLAAAGEQAAHELKSAGLTVYALGYGSMIGSKITIEADGKQSFLLDKQNKEVVSRMDAAGLRAVAEASGGEFVRADAMPLPLRELYRKRLLPMQKRAFESGEDKVQIPRYQWALLPMLLLLLHDLMTAQGRRR
ncbi:MAG: VWA domain-containing protein [Planctomycetota bacterium]|jgi:Ca-activated chloride channel family protein